MGLINFVRHHVRRRRIVRRFSSYVDAVLVDGAIANSDAASPPPASRAIDFVLALLRDETLAGVPAALEEVVHLARMHNGFTEVLVGPLVFVTFGVPIADADAAAHRRALAALAEALGDRVKVLHGSGAGLVGEVAGSAGVFGSVVRGFSGLLATLTALPFGEVREVNP